MSTPEESIEVRAKNVTAAIEEGLRRLNMRREQVEIDIISPGSRGVLGFGAEDARVRLTPIRPAGPAPVPATRPAKPPADVSPPPKPAAPAPAPAPAPARPDTAAVPVRPAPSTPPPPAKPEVAVGPGTAQDPEDTAVTIATSVLSELLRLMGINATVRGHFGADAIRDKDEEAPLVLDIVGSDLGILIGRRGETLSALQYITRLMVNHQLQHWTNIVVDVEEYKNRRERTLQQLAVRTAERVAATGRTMALEPMPARERRIIHLTLRDHPEVTTQSVGEGEHRKVTIVSKSSES